MFQLGPLKTPGPDGFNGLFFFNQKLWDTVGNDVDTAVKGFFNDGILLKEFNLTNFGSYSESEIP